MLAQKKKMKCYFQGCVKDWTTKEHIPPKAFFPKDQREQLITVRSCRGHNIEKSGDDLYALAQICLNSSSRNLTREVFLKSVVPQLGFNDDAFRKILNSGFGSVREGSGQVQSWCSKARQIFQCFILWLNLPRRKKPASREFLYGKYLPQFDRWNVVSRRNWVDSFHGAVLRG